MAYQSGIKKDVVQLLILFLATLIIYYPVFYEEYAYRDDFIGLWEWGSGRPESTNTLLQFGRNITAVLGKWLFGSAIITKHLNLIRIFSLCGWLLCIPVWYYVIKKVLYKEDLSPALCFFSVLYLICTPSFAVSVGWTACFEMFIANTAGIVSGYFFYKSIKKNSSVRQSLSYAFFSIISGLLSLFTYQNGFGFFLLPFLLHFLHAKKITKELLTGMIACAVIYVIYFLLYRYSIYANNLVVSERTLIDINVGRKFIYFLARPLGSSFRFTYLFNETNVMGYVVSAALGGLWFFFAYRRLSEITIGNKIKYFAVLFFLLGFIFVPALITADYFASSRILFALKIAVFFLTMETLLAVIHTERARAVTVFSISIFFVVNAWYNFNRQFLYPAKQEYVALKTFFEEKYTSNQDTIYFLQTPQDFFEEKYNITRSWDEFAEPSSFPYWMVSFIVKQLVFEKTGDRSLSERLVIKNSADKKVLLESVDLFAPRNFFIDTPAILNKE